MQRQHEVRVTVRLLGQPTHIGLGEVKMVLGRLFGFSPRLNRRAGLIASARCSTASSRMPAKMPTALLTTVALDPLRVMDAAHAFTSKLSTLLASAPRASRTVEGPG
jgi:hypothetical protein